MKWLAIMWTVCAALDLFIAGFYLGAGANRKAVHTSLYALAFTILALSETFWSTR